MEIPSKVRITRRIHYEVLWVQEFHNCPDTLGECRPNEKQIVLKVGQTPDQLLKTFIHEVFHAFKFEYPSLKKLGHREIYGLELPIYNFLKLNKLL